MRIVYTGLVFKELGDFMRSSCLRGGVVYEASVYELRIRGLRETV